MTDINTITTTTTTNTTKQPQPPPPPTIIPTTTLIWDLFDTAPDDNGGDEERGGNLPLKDVNTQNTRIEPHELLVVPFQADTPVRSLTQYMQEITKLAQADENPDVLSHTNTVAKYNYVD